MKISDKIVSSLFVLQIFGSFFWFIRKPDFEPAISIMAGVIGLAIFARDLEQSIKVGSEKAKRDNNTVNIRKNWREVKPRHSNPIFQTTSNYSDQLPLNKSIIALTIGTTIIHFSLAFYSQGAFVVLFALNGLGYLALIAALYYLPQLAGQRQLVRWALLVFTAVTFILYFVFNWPDIWSPMGIGDKVIELILIILLWQEK